jgi:hypothetical protein
MLLIRTRHLRGRLRRIGSIGEQLEEKRCRPLEMRVEQRNGNLGLPLDRGLHDRRVFSDGVSVLVTEDRHNIAIAFGAIEQGVVKAQHPSRAARRDQCHMKGPVQSVPIRIHGRIVRKAERCSFQPVKGQNDALFPGYVTMSDCIPQRDLIHPAPRSRQLYQVVGADRRNSKSLLLLLQDKPFGTQARKSLAQRTEVDPMLRTTGSGFLGGTAAVRVSQ